MNELATLIENAWMSYNAAVVNKLHVKEEKDRLANLVINNTKDIVKALRAYPETADVLTEEPKKARKNGER